MALLAAPCGGISGLVQRGDYIRVRRLRAGASYMMRAEDIALWDGMDAGARRQIKRAGWPEAQLSGEAFVLGRMASAVGDTDGVARSRTTPAANGVPELVLRDELVWWPVAEIVAVLTVEDAAAYELGNVDAELRGVRDAFVTNGVGLERSASLLEPHENLVKMFRRKLRLGFETELRKSSKDGKTPNTFGRFDFGASADQWAIIQKGMSADRNAFAMPAADEDDDEDEDEAGAGRGGSGSGSSGSGAPAGGGGGGFGAAGAADGGGAVATVGGGGDVGTSADADDAAAARARTGDTAGAGRSSTDRGGAAPHASADNRAALAWCARLVRARARAALSSDATPAAAGEEVEEDSEGEGDETVPRSSVFAGVWRLIGATAWRHVCDGLLGDLYVRPGGSVPGRGGGEGTDFFTAHALLLFIARWGVDMVERVGGMDETPPRGYVPPPSASSVTSRRERPQTSSSLVDDATRAGRGGGAEEDEEEEDEDDHDHDDGAQRKRRAPPADPLPKPPRLWRVRRKMQRKHPWRSRARGVNVQVDERSRVQHVTLRSQEEMVAMTEYLGLGWNVGVGRDKLRFAAGKRKKRVKVGGGWAVNAIVGGSEAENSGVTLSWDPTSANITVKFRSVMFKDPKRLKARFNEHGLRW